MNTKWIVSLLLTLVCLGKLNAMREPDFLKNYLSSYPRSFSQTFSAPDKWQTRDWMAAGGVVLVAGGLYLVDPDLRDIIQAGRTDWGDAAMSGFSQLGDGAILFPAVGAFMMSGYLAESDKTIDTGLLCLKSMILSSVTTQGLKLATQRPRPNDDYRSSFWSGEGFSMSYASFPSGHSSLIWSMAPILAEQYPDQVWVAPVAYGAAILTSYSRLNNDVHWASDVFVGAVIGYLSAKMTLKGTPRLAVAPAPNLQGVSLTYEF